MTSTPDRACVAADGGSGATECLLLALPYHAADPREDSPHYLNVELRTNAPPFGASLSAMTNLDLAEFESNGVLVFLSLQPNVEDGGTERAQTGTLDVTEVTPHFNGRLTDVTFLGTGADQASKCNSTLKGVEWDAVIQSQ